MPLKNTTKRQTLEQNVVVCSSFIPQARGLLFRKKQSAVFLFSRPKKASLHMIGMLYPIDVLVLDKQKRVREIKKDLRPFQFYTSRQKGYYVVEIPSGQLRDTELGDVLSFP